MEIDFSTKIVTPVRSVYNAPSFDHIIYPSHLGVMIKIKGVMSRPKVSTCFHILYHEQVGPIPSSNGSLDIALSNAHVDAFFRPSTQQNWPRDWELTPLLVFASISRLTR